MTVQEAHINRPGASFNAPPAEGSEGEMNLLDVLVQLAIRKGLIAKVAGAALLVGVLLCIFLPVKYTAQTDLMPPQQSPSAASLMIGQLSAVGGMSSLASLAGGGLGLKSPNDIYIGLLQSRPVADAIIKEFDLTKVYGSKDMTAARKKLDEYTDIKSDKSSLLSITVTDRDKNRAAAMANAYTDELRLLTKDIATTEASRRVMFYESQLNDAKDALSNAENNLQNIEQKKGVIQPEAQVRAMIESLTLLRAEVASKQVEVDSLRLSSTENNPQLLLAEQELAALQAQVSRMEQKSQATTGLSSLDLSSLPGAGLDYLRAAREVQYQQALYGLLLKQLDAAKLDEAKDATIIQVVTPAIAPDRKSSPKRLVIMLVSLFLGLFIGCAMALVSWWISMMQSNPQSAQQWEILKRSLSLRTTRTPV
jgi:uncharacterized protein involved in exopolysaccharide biosynthesis